MKKPAKTKELRLEDILFNCRDLLRGKASVADKRDLMLTLVFLRFIGEKFTVLREEIKKTLEEIGATGEFYNKQLDFPPRYEEKGGDYAKPELYRAVKKDEIAEKGYSLVPSRYIEFVDRDTELDYKTALKTDKEKFKALGITFEEKAFYDILVAVRDDNKFEYADEKCLDLAKKIKALIDNSTIYADWINNKKLRARLNVEIVNLLYVNGYPPEWHDKVYDRVMEQVDNFKRHAPEDEPLASEGVEVTDNVHHAMQAIVYPDEEISENLRFVSFLPLYTLKAACGYFMSGEAVEREGWIKAEGIGKLDNTMVVVRAVGDSMEPKIHDGDLCVMRSLGAVDYNNRIVLVQRNDQMSDPDGGGAYLLKKYVKKGEGAILRSLNPEKRDIEIEDEPDVTAVAYLHKVLYR